MITQEQLPMVAMDSMNDTHLEDLLMINAISKAIDNQEIEKISTMLQELIEHTVAHFSGEEEMMREKMFPPYPIHKGEHDRALNELRAVSQNFEDTKDLQTLQNYIDTTLSPWLIEHIQTLDTVTAMFLVHGQSPCSGGAC